MEGGEATMRVQILRMLLRINIETRLALKRTEKLRKCISSSTKSKHHTTRRLPTTNVTALTIFAMA
jgi:hypothetical protein